MTEDDQKIRADGHRSFCSLGGDYYHDGCCTCDALERERALADRLAAALKEHVAPLSPTDWLDEDERKRSEGALKAWREARETGQ